MRRWIYLAVAAAALGACASGPSGIDAGKDADEAALQQKDCANPDWKAAHLGIWYSVCRPNAALR